MLRGLTLLALLALVTGCEDERASVPATTTGPTPPAVVALPDLEWRAVVDDWYDNGTFDDAHTCAAVRKAIVSVPKRDYSPPLEDFESYADLVCGKT